MYGLIRDAPRPIEECMATKRATWYGNKIKDLRAKRLRPRTARSVKGGSENTRHPAKVTVPDLKLT